MRNTDGDTSGARGRLVGVDVVRGLFLVIFLACIGWYTAPAWFEHAPWAGVHPIDLVFPAFVTLTGVGLGLAHRGELPALRTMADIARRCVVLVVAGLAYNAHAQVMTSGAFDAGVLRWTGVLQLFALATAAVSVLHLVLRSSWAWGVGTALLAAGYTAYLIRYAGGCPGDALTLACNPSGPLDAAVFGVAHIYRQGVAGHDPEGLPAMAGALVSAAAGVAGGHLLRSFGGDAGLRRRATRAALLLGWAVACLLLARITAPLVVTTKRLWTPPFAATAAAGVLAVVAVAHLACDGRIDRGGPTAAMRGLTWPLIALGRNSLLVYFGAQALMTALTSRPLGTKRTWAHQLADAVAVFDSPALGFDLALVVAFTGLAAVLHWRHIYLRP